MCWTEEPITENNRILTGLTISRCKDLVYYSARMTDNKGHMKAKAFPYCDGGMHLAKLWRINMELESKGYVSKQVRFQIYQKSTSLNKSFTS